MSRIAKPSILHRNHQPRYYLTLPLKASPITLAFFIFYSALLAGALGVTSAFRLGKK